ncbi:MAG: hypothetical protein KKH28_04460 [Elusimicrobia bacterium]|nr:hypothetical protein [Elusimicrobiota bacterium]
MKKLAKSITCIILAAASGSAFAQSGVINNSVLENVLAGTDAQLAPALNSALGQLPFFTLPAPAMARDGARNRELTDVTEKWTCQGDVISAYPKIYKLFHSEENSRIIKIFHFTDPKGSERRIEVYFTGGDWMQYGLTYFATTAGPSKDQANVYPISDLSTSDPEDGAIAPKSDPFDFKKLADFIINDFLDADGNVKSGFKSIAAAAVTP